MTPGHADQLTHRLVLRHLHPSRFWLSPDLEPWLVIEALTPEGRKRYAHQSRQLRERVTPETRVHTGLLLVDDAGRFVFCGPTAGPDLLADLREVADSQLPTAPSLATLEGAGAAKIPLDLKDDEALAGVSVGELEVIRDPSLWTGLLVPDLASVTAALDATAAGDHVWYWLDSQPDPERVPILVQPTRWDPDRFRLVTLLRALHDRGLTEGAIGLGVVVDDGGLQLIGPDLTAGHLEVLSTWVLRHIDAHPDLRRLVGCELVRTEGGRVAEIFTADWGEHTRPVVRGTLAETARILADLPPDRAAWFWGTAVEGGHLHLVPLEDDPDGDRFRADVVDLIARFDARDGIAGTLSRLPTGQLLLTSKSPRAQAWSDTVQTLLDTHGSVHPALAELEDARFFVMERGQPTRVQ